MILNSIFLIRFFDKKIRRIHKEYFVKKEAFKTGNE